VPDVQRHKRKKKKNEAEKKNQWELKHGKGELRFESVAREERGVKKKKLATRTNDKKGKKESLLRTEETTN